MVIVIDPKGDADLLNRVYVEAKRAGREGEFYVFHLGWPDISARYNAVGRFGRISEVATRVAGQPPGKATARRSASLRGASSTSSPAPWWNWGSAGLHADPAPCDQHRRAVHRVRPALLRQDRAQGLGGDRPDRGQAQRKEHPAQHDRARKRVVALEQYLSQARNYDPVLDGLRSAVRCDKTYFRQDRRIAAAAAGEAHQRQDRPASGPELL